MLALDQILATAEKASRLVPPAWPLSATVAVNPFLGHTADDLATATARLRRVGGLSATMPRHWYAEKISTGTITEADITAAISANAAALTIADVRAALAEDRPRPTRVPTIADLAGAATGQDWEAIVTERIGVWAAAQFDQGQALWTAARGVGPNESWGAYASWRSFATHDLTPEILGLPNFASHVAGAPQHADEAIVRAAARLKLTAGALETYFHALLTALGGWAQIARWRLWQAEMANETDRTLTDLLAIRLVWEEALWIAHEPEIATRWAQAVEQHAAPLAPTRDDRIDAVLQEAADRAAQRHLAETLSAPPSAVADGRPRLQAAFCIDVRSEVYRRALESIDPAIETIGFAGFFGLPLAHRAFGSCQTEAHLPVLLKPALRTCVAVTPELEAAENDRRIAARAKRAWGRFKQAAVSSFAFVEAAGPLYAGRLIADTLRVGSSAPKPDPKPVLGPEIDVATRVSVARAVLGAMSLSSFGKVVLVVGHGANVVNNPHASALHCGACGGQTGEVSARVLAALLNETAVRQGLAEAGLSVPADTVFVGGLHDTTGDVVTVYADDVADLLPAEDLRQVLDWLAGAGRAARAERALRLPRAASETDILQRTRDWSEVRPEWGLAGCKAFIAAPRTRTAGRDLGGRAFLHSYDWQQDTSFGVLELILTAPVVVASWISLQYYGSVVAPEAFGAGNKLLHNVVGGIGVLEGNGGPPRVGLPWQSVHDGERLVHEPVRLSVLIEAPREAITDVLRRHPGVRELFDRRWLHLFALDDQGQIAWRYSGNLEWSAEDGAARGPSRHAA